MTERQWWTCTSGAQWFIQTPQMMRISSWQFLYCTGPEAFCQGSGAGDIRRVTMATRVGFIGLGNMGKPMAINLAKAGFDLMVYDLRPEPMRELAGVGAKCARSADEL